MTRVLLATCSDLPNGDEDDGLLLTGACDARGLDTAWAVWDDPGVEWSGAALTVIRSTWDYTSRRSDFLAWAGAVPALANPASVVRWNSDKHYLRDLERAGVPIVATTWVAPGAQPDRLAGVESSLDVEFPAHVDFVLKPTVGAGSMGAGRFGPGGTDAARQHLRELQAAGRSVMMQPYLAGVDDDGETALIFIDGSFSHAVRKAPMLAEGMVHDVHRRPDRALFVEERITARTPSPAQLSLADAALAAVSQHVPGPDEPLLYARVDLLPGPDGPVLIELELTEPSLFLSFGDHAADRLAEAIAARVDPA